MGGSQAQLAGIPAGAPICIEIEGLKMRLNSILVGLRNKRYLIVTVPGPQAVKPQTVYPLLYPGNAVTCYAVMHGVATAFKCFIIRFVLNPFPLVFLSFPENVETVQVRRHPRIECVFQATLTSGSKQIDGLITDLSLGGCGFAFPAGQTEAELEFNTPATLESRQLDAVGAKAFHATLRSRFNRADRIRLGLKFQDMPEDAVSELKRFLLDAEWFARN